jgi:glycerophosphoryl diester phosphodiesterase
VGGRFVTEVWSHRGRVLPGDEVDENTVAAFCRASAAGVAGIELDVWLTLDGAWVVHHDRRCVAGDIDRLRRCDVPPVIPGLSDALAACAVETVNVELKVPPAAGRAEAGRLGRGLARYLTAEISTAEVTRRVVLSSFSKDAVDAALGCRAELPAALLLGAAPTQVEVATLARQGYWAANVEHTKLGPQQVAMVHEAGLWVVAWTVDRQADIARLAQQGVDVLISNLPTLPDRSS